MFKRTWLHCLAVAGLLVVSGGHSSDAQDHRERQPEARQTEQDKPQANPSPPLPITVTGPVRVEREKEIEPDWNKLKCSEAKSHEEADLCEQRRMANAAEEAVRLNWLQVVLGVAGFFALVTSLLLNRRATNAAVAAADTAEKAMFDLEAPFLYPAIVGSSLKQDFGPFVLQDNPRSRHDPIAPKIRFRIANHGKGTAILQSYKAAAAYVASTAVVPNLGRKRESEHSIIEPQKVVPTGQLDSFDIKVSPPLTPDNVRAILERQGYLVVHGEFSFVGVHGANYIQTFGLVLESKKLTPRFIPLGAQYNKRTREHAEKIPTRKWWQFGKKQMSKPPQ